MRRIDRVDNVLIEEGELPSACTATIPIFVVRPGSFNSAKPVVKQYVHSLSHDRAHILFQKSLCFLLQGKPAVGISGPKTQVKIRGYEGGYSNL